MTEYPEWVRKILDENPEIEAYLDDIPTEEVMETLVTAVAYLMIGDSERAMLCLGAFVDSAGSEAEALVRLEHLLGSCITVLWSLTSHLANVMGGVDEEGSFTQLGDWVNHVKAHMDSQSEAWIPGDPRFN